MDINLNLDSKASEIDFESDKIFKVIHQTTSIDVLINCLDRLKKIIYLAKKRNDLLEDLDCLEKGGVCLSATNKFRIKVLDLLIIKTQNKELSINITNKVFSSLD